MKTPFRFNQLPSFAAIIAALFAGAVSTNDAPVCALLLGEAAAVAARSDARVL